MDEPRVLFLADQFAEAARDNLHSHPGGAELTDAVAISNCPWPIETARIGHFHPQHLADFDLHVVANGAEASDELLAALADRGRHVMFEHDVRICDWRGNFPAASDALHRRLQRCHCRHRRWEDVFASSLGSIFLTHRQLRTYLTNPYFTPSRTAVLGSSLMNRAFMDRARSSSPPREERPIDAAILDSGQRIKGTDPARKFCEARGVEPREISGLAPEEVLDVLEETKTFVYLPLALEPAGRMLLESRFLGCAVVANGYTGVVGESWWNLDDQSALDVLADAPQRFWRIVDRFRRRQPPDSSSPPGSWAERIEFELERLGASGARLLELAREHVDRSDDRVTALRRPTVVTQREPGVFT